MNISSQEALLLASAHASTTEVDDPDYWVTCRYEGPLPEGWLFTYEIERICEEPGDEPEQLAGAGGFIVTLDGEIEELTAPMHIEKLKALGPG